MPIQKNFVWLLLVGFLVVRVEYDRDVDVYWSSERKVGVYAW